MTADGVEFHDRIATGWTKGYSRGSFRRRLNHLDRLLRPVIEPGDHWLDAGCGSGVLARRISELGADVDAVDASAAMVAAAERETIQSSQDIRFNVIESVEKLDFGDQSFDGILCSSVVEYVSEPDLVFSEFSRILKPNGCLILSVPNKLSAMRGIQHFSRHIMSKFGIDIFGYLTVSVNDFSKNEINRRLELFNMCSTEVRPFDPIFSLFGCSTKLDALLVVVAKKRG